MEEDPNIGKLIWVLTKTGKGRNKREEWCEAVIESKDREEEYIAKYKDKKWKKHAVSIPDLLDESYVRFDPPSQVGSEA